MFLKNSHFDERTLPSGPLPITKLFFHICLEAFWALSFRIFIGPESNHWQPLSVTLSLTLCCLVLLIDVTLACEYANLLRLLLLLILKMRIVLASVCFRFWS